MIFVFLWITSLSMISFMLIHVVANSITSFSYLSILHIYHCFFIHSPVKGHVGCFHVFLVMVNRAAMRIGLPVSFQIIIFFRYISKSWIPGPYCNSFFNFLFVCLFLTRIYVKSWLIGKDPDTRKDWCQEEMFGWHHGLNGHEFEQTSGHSEGEECLAFCSLFLYILFLNMVLEIFLISFFYIYLSSFSLTIF